MWSYVLAQTLVLGYSTSTSPGKETKDTDRPAGWSQMSPTLYTVTPPLIANK